MRCWPLSTPHWRGLRPHWGWRSTVNQGRRKAVGVCTPALVVVVVVVVVVVALVVQVVPCPSVPTLVAVWRLRVELCCYRTPHCRAATRALLAGAFQQLRQHCWRYVSTSQAAMQTWCAGKVRGRVTTDCVWLFGASLQRKGAMQEGGGCGETVKAWTGQRKRV
jgi:hypothetical protein